MTHSAGTAVGPGGFDSSGTARGWGRITVACIIVVALIFLLVAAYFISVGYLEIGTGPVFGHGIGLVNRETKTVSRTGTTPSDQLGQRSGGIPPSGVTGNTAGTSGSVGGTVGDTSGNPGGGPLGATLGGR